MSWQTVQLGDLIEPTKGALVSGPFGSNIGSRFFVEDGVPVIRGNNLTKGSERFIDSGFVFLTEQKASEFPNCVAIADDIVFTAAGSIGQVGIVPQTSNFERYIISNKQIRARLDTSKIDPLFAYIWLSSPQMVRHIESQNNGGAVPLLNLGLIRRLPVPVPPLSEQLRIADILSAYDDLIENNRKRIALLEEAARMLFREWFVHFRFPGHEHVPIIDAMPEGWERRTVGEVAEVRLGKMLDAKKNRGELRPYLANVNVRWGGFDLVDLREMRFEDNELEKFGLSYGDIVMCEGGEPGRCAIWKAQLPGMMIQKALHRIRPRADLDYLFLYHRLSFMAKSGRLEGLFTGSTIKHLPREKLVKAVIEVPPMRLMREFAARAAPLEAQARTLEDAILRASQARDLLLPRLMNGEITV